MRIMFTHDSSLSRSTESLAIRVVATHALVRYMHTVTVHTLYHGTLSLTTYLSRDSISYDLSLTGVSLWHTLTIHHSRYTIHSPSLSNTLPYRWCPARSTLCWRTILILFTNTSESGNHHYALHSCYERFIPVLQPSLLALANGAIGLY